MQSVDAWWRALSNPGGGTEPEGETLAAGGYHSKPWLIFPSSAYLLNTILGDIYSSGQTRDHQVPLFLL